MAIKLEGGGLMTCSLSKALFCGFPYVNMPDFLSSPAFYDVFGVGPGVNTKIKFWLFTYFL